MSTENRTPEEKKAELRAELEVEQKKKKLFLVLTAVTTVLLLIAILVFAFNIVPNPIVPIIGFALFITCFMLFAYSRQNIARLEERLEE